MEKACITSRNRIYTYLTQLIKEINETDILFHNAEIGTRKEYTIEYVEYILMQYKKITGIDITTFVHGSGKRKTATQKHYEKLEEYLKRLKNMHIILRCVGKIETATQKLIKMQPLCVLKEITWVMTSFFPHTMYSLGYVMNT